METQRKPWPALWALVIGFFMILVDSTIVSIANPAILRDLDTDITSVLWVTSAYLLAYAVPLLITGRLGDRFGPKNIYMIGLVVFTARLALVRVRGRHHDAHRGPRRAGARRRPDDAADDGRHHPHLPAEPARRGHGPVGRRRRRRHPGRPDPRRRPRRLLGWEWIFFVNVPVGVVAFVLAWRLVPKLETHSHRFDLLGVAAQRGRHVPAGLRHPGGRDLRLGHHRRADHRVGSHHHRHRRAGRLRGLAALQPGRAAAAARALQATATSRSRTSAISLVGFAIMAMPLPLSSTTRLPAG